MNAHIALLIFTSTLMVVLCVGIHGIGLFSLSRALRTESNVERLRRTTALSFRGAMFTLGIVLLIFVIHGVEIWAYAFFYLAVGATTDLLDAVYFSTISYTTVGYNDNHITEEWRLVGAFESILGMIMIGWSTAFFFKMLSRIEDN
jgi:hypothetical protein